MKPSKTPIGKNFKRGREVSKVNSKRTLNRLLFFDVEAYIEKIDEKTEKHKTRLIVYRYVELDDEGKVKFSEYGNSNSNEGFVDYLLSKAIKDITLYVICHNANYDIQISGVVNRLLEQGYKVTKAILEFPPFVMSFSKGKHRITFFDNLNFARTSIKELGKSIGLEKYEIDYHQEEDKDKWIEYAYRDIEILSEFFIRYYKFLIDNDLSPFALTIAGQAFKTFRYRFMKEEIPLHKVEEVTNIERYCYIGGRVECFKLGRFEGEKFYKLDINSMYPYVMKHFLYPYAYLGRKDDIPIDEFIDIFGRFYVIAVLEIEIDKPLVPVRLKDRVIYPIGKFQAILHKPEIGLVFEYGKIIKINRVFVYTARNIFEEYVDYFYTLKVDAEMKGDNVNRSMAKLFLNSLYGKFGQLGYIDIYKDSNDDEIGFYRYKGFSEELNKEVMITRVGSKTITTIREGESYYSNPAIAGSVTSYARSYLALLIMITGIENVFYVDTDSLIVNYEGYQRLNELIDKHELGKLKLEGISELLIINGLKDYVFGNEVKIKGVNKNAIKVSDNVYINTHFRGGKTWLNEGGEENVIVEYVTKTLKREYKKGLVYGFEVVPFTLPNPEISLLISP